MNKFRRLSLLGTTALASIIFSAQAEVISISTMDEFQEYINQRKPIVVDISTEWCGACKMMKPVIDELSNDPAFKNVSFLYLDGDNKALTPLFKDTFRIEAFPTFVFIDCNGNQTSSIRGSRSKTIMKQHIEQAMGKRMVYEGDQPPNGRPSIQKQPIRVPATPKDMGQPTRRPADMPMKKEVARDEMMRQPMPEKKTVITNGGLSYIETPEQFARDVIASNKPVIIQFRKTDCAICNNVEQELTQLSAGNRMNIKFVQINTQNNKLRNVIKGEGLLALPSYDFISMKELEAAKAKNNLSSTINNFIIK